MRVVSLNKLPSFSGTILSFLLLTVLIFIPAFKTEAQGTTERPRIGLALSGGGAHGIAHLGVLKVMEEAGLRPDYITGVSMGSIVGGMYAIGYSADSIEQILKTIDWDLLIGNKIPENKIIYQEKDHFYNSIISLPVSFRKVHLPSGLINGQQMENMLSYYAWPAADINDFSMLPIPFLAIGSDIISGMKVQLTKGYLPEAMRASSAVPSIFTPFTIDSCLIVDGGLFRNIAISELKDRGADIIIGSYTGFYPLSTEELQSVDGQIKQIGLLSSYKDFNDQKQLINLLTEPYTKDLSITDFTKIDTLIQRGYKAALPLRKKFTALADSLDKISPQKPLNNLLDKKYYVFDRVEVTGNKINSDEQILGILGISPGEKTDKNRLSEGIELLYGKAWFEKVRYIVQPRNDSLILVIDCVEKPRSMFYGSVNYDNTLESAFLLSFSGKNLLTKKSVINIDSRIGKNYRLKINIIQFVDRNQKYGISAEYITDRTPLPLISVEGEEGRMISRNYYMGFSLNSRIGLNHMMKLTEEIDNLNLLPDFITHNGLKRLSYNYLSTRLEYDANTLDDKHFPDNGLKYAISLGSSKLLEGVVRSDSLTDSYTEREPGAFSFNRFHTFYGNIRYYFSVSSKTTFSLGGHILYITDSDSITAQNNFFLLGGNEPISKRSIPMTGFHANQIAVRDAAGLAFEADIEVLKDVHLAFSASAFAIQEEGRKHGFSFPVGYGVSLGYMSVVGPLRLGIMHGIYNRETYFSPLKGFISFGYLF